MEVPYDLAQDINALVTSTEHIQLSSFEATRRTAQEAGGREAGCYRSSHKYRCLQLIVQYPAPEIVQNLEPGEGSLW